MEYNIYTLRYRDYAVTIPLLKKKGAAGEGMGEEGEVAGCRMTGVLEMGWEGWVRAAGGVAPVAWSPSVRDRYSSTAV